MNDATPHHHHPHHTDGHHHGHEHSHGHRHGHAHVHKVHAAVDVAPRQIVHIQSLVLTSVAERLAYVAALAVALWAVTFWALP